MSRTDKPKPPDKVESAPKPSRKVAIEEVLRSLQDLVKNELSIDEPRPGTPAATVTAPAAPAPETEIPIAPAAALAPVDVAAHTDITIDLEVPPGNAPETTAAPESAPVVKQPAPPEGLQQDLPFLESEPAIEAPATAAVESSSLLVEPDYPSPELPGTDELPGDHTSPAGASVAGEPGHEPASLTDAPFPDSRPDQVPALEATPAVDHADSADADTTDLNDIPVLEDAVDPAEEPELHAALDQSPPSATTLPAARDGRRLAIQVAARLNVELRKAGQPGLSSDIIARLAHLLEETLAKGAANMENSPKTKH